MAAGKLHFKSDAGGITSVLREAGATNGELVLPTSGTVVSVSSAVTDNAIARYDSTTGKLQNSAITIDDSGNIGSGTQSFNGFGGSGFKNYIINGNFDVWQYGVSQTSSGYGSDDRWTNRNIGSTKTHSAVTCTDNERALFSASKFSRTVVSSVSGAGNVVDKYQKIEDVTKLAGKTVTMSFWAKADTSKNIAIEFWQHFGSGGSPSTAVLGINAQLVSLTSTWQKKTITVTLPSIVGKTLGTDGTHTSYTAVGFWFDAGSNSNSRAANLGQQSGTFDIAQVQLEEGSIATPFENRPYGLELSLCQRYYEIFNTRIAGYQTIGAEVSYIYSFKANKRIIPTIGVINSPVLTNTSSITHPENTVTGVAIRAIAIATGTTMATGGLNYASAEL